MFTFPFRHTIIIRGVDMYLTNVGRDKDRGTKYVKDIV